MATTNVVVRALRAVKKRGVAPILCQVCRSVAWHMFNRVAAPLLYGRYEREISPIVTSASRIFIWKQKFGWNVTLWQRPQHIESEFARLGNTVFYYVDHRSDPGIWGVKRERENLYLVNYENRTLMKVLFSKLDLCAAPKYIHFYSTEAEMTADDLKGFQAKGYRLLYEYVDDIAPELSVQESVPPNILEKYDYVMEHPEVTAVVTADALKRNVEQKRGTENLIFAGNGANVNHFSLDLGEKITFCTAFENVLRRGRRIVGYYGALAVWFDYELLRTAALELPEVEFVLIGHDYDGSFQRSKVGELPNITYVGPVSYRELPYYARRFDVCTIPFVLNSITEATSPLKLFEYMALKKPVVTTDMPECRKYRSVMIAHGVEEFIRLVMRAMDMTEDNAAEYYRAQAEELSNNTWDKKASEILNGLLRKEEK